MDNRTVETEVVAVAAAVIFAGGRVLVTSRPAGKTLAGKWEFPGGKVEPGESVAEALRRELIEELSLEVEVFEQVYRLEVPGRKLLVISFMRCTAPHPEALRALEGQEWRWVSPDELGEVDLLPADRPVAEFLQQHYNKCNRDGVYYR